MGFFGKIKDAQAQAQQAMGHAGAGMGTMGGGDMQAQAAAAQLAQKLHAQGVEAPGVLHGFRQVGQPDVGGGRPTELDVSIRPANGDPYQTTIRQSMLPAQLEGLAEGAPITVKYDPDQPQMAMIFGW